MFWYLLGRFYGKHHKTKRKAPYNYSASFWTSNFPISLWERPRTLNFHDRGIFGRVPEPQNQCDPSLEHCRDALALRVSEYIDSIFKILKKT